MSTYTSTLNRPLESIAWEDENFVEELLDVARLFRPFSEAMDEFIVSHGYEGSLEDINRKTAFIRAAFESAGMTPPREIREWFTSGQQVKRDTAFQICFAFRLDGMETDDFFQRIVARERSFNCHRVEEAVYYFCLNHALTYADALDIQSHVPLACEDGPDAVAVYTGSIIADLNSLETREELIDYLTENIEKFSTRNVTAYDEIRKFWSRTAGPDGLLLQESREMFSEDNLDIPHTREGIKPWDAYLAILHLNKHQVSRLQTDRSIKPILTNLHAAAQDSFPDRQGIDLILRGRHVSFERVRKWLILLSFYTFWAEKALEAHTYAAGEGDNDRCVKSMNSHLTMAGYPELFVGNPYDWIFLYAAKDAEPLVIFREIWKSLLGAALE